jgi:peptidoglycan hydrolase-like protein with peptidoglycan-binding domain
MCLFNRYPVLRLYDRGPKVREASLLLAKHGSSLKPTDCFSIAMRSAVMAFQKKHGLMQIPMVDKATWKALKKKHKTC